jgi:hypothetical protein
MAGTTKTTRKRPNRPARQPAPVSQPDLARLGAHESRGAGQPPAVDREKLNSELRRDPVYQGP